MCWRAKDLSTFDCEFGFSCMGYEIAGGWGAKLADPSRDVIVMVGDGSYLLMNSDIYSSVLTGLKLIVVVCDNGGFAVIDRLQRAKGIPSFNNQLADIRHEGELVRVDFAKHAEVDGCDRHQRVGHRRARGRLPPRQASLPHHRHPRAGPSHRLDRGQRRLVGVRHARGLRARLGPRRPRRARGRQEEAAGRRLSGVR